MVKFTPKVAAATSEEKPRDLWLEPLVNRLQKLIAEYRQASNTPGAAHQFEKDLKPALDAAGAAILEQEFNRLEADAKQELPPKLRYRGETYRINKKTKAEIASSFGPITVWSFLYLCEEPGEPGLHP